MAWTSSNCCVRLETKEEVISDTHSGSLRQRNCPVVRTLIPFSVDDAILLLILNHFHGKPRHNQPGALEAYVDILLLDLKGHFKRCYDGFSVA